MSNDTRREFFKKGATVLASAAVASALQKRGQAQTAAPGPDAPGSAVAATRIADGPFQPSWDSLKQYQTPEWFRDAKFGIWAHWTAQCVPEQGDWYARNMYIQYDKNGKPGHDYQYQCEHYGHPSKVGFKDIDHLWKAENWDPEKLIETYKAAGAKYFVALANHHDNFDCFDSAHQPWNSVKIGPRKDIVGGWAKAARKNGLRFGVTVHAGRSWSWYEVAQGADTDGPLAGVPYDGKLTRADGKGQWWEGLDPQDLYAQNHPLKAKPDQAYIDKFYLRTRELIDKYHPDLLYFDDSVMPLNGASSAGLHLAAHLYNTNARRHGGRNEAVLNTKGLNEEQRKCLVWDIERGRSERIEPLPWQTDTCIGQWHYSRGLFEHHGYKTADTVVKTLVDIVSKNGNLLLNIPLRGDGTPDADEIKVLNELAPWMTANGEAIFGTRPWKVFGEGPSVEAAASPLKGAGFNENRARPYTAEDIRFTVKGNTLYAIALGWPTTGKVTIKSLMSNARNLKADIAHVQLLGSPAQLSWTRTADGLSITLPSQKPGDYAFAFKITVKGSI